MESKPVTPNVPKRCGPSLSFEATCAVVERMHNNFVRQRVGGLEIVSGLVDGDEITERVTLVIDPVTGASYVSEWSAA